ncbi:MAG TPA: dihydrolipoamide acetyltransferase family protein [Draconibacterium sp.]|nr:dihydrolipoamide acetyltransferase family protein [Draconibacterium sp.]
MAEVVIMPKQGQSVESCILGQWFKDVGEEVNKGDLLFSYETDKASFEEEAKVNGILLATFFEEGDEIPVLTNVAVIGQKGESIDEFKPGAEPAAETVQAEEPIEESPKVFEFEVEESEDGARIRISPLARNMAEMMGVDFQNLKGSGPHGRIIARDVETASKTVREGKATTVVSFPKAAPEVVLRKGDGYEIKAIPNIRKLIASAMHQSLQNSAQLTHHLSADARQILKLRKNFKKQMETGEIKENVTINDLVCFAVIRALEKFPQANTHFLGDKMKWFNKVHLGLAVDTERGLMVPALKNASDLSITGLSSQLKQLSSAARNGNINPDLLNPEEASFTVSNLGNYGVEMFTPVINLPQTAILGVCTIVLRPKEIEEGVIGFVPMMGLSLTYDHQALDGGEATLFLAEIKNQIENLSL